MVTLCGDVNARIGHLKDSFVEIDHIPNGMIIDKVKE